MTAPFAKIKMQLKVTGVGGIGKRNAANGF
jgi:hypothetical protein